MASTEASLAQPWTSGSRRDLLTAASAAAAAAATSAAAAARASSACRARLSAIPFLRSFSFAFCRAFFSACHVTFYQSMQRLSSDTTSRLVCRKIDALEQQLVTLYVLALPDSRMATEESF